MVFEDDRDRVAFVEYATERIDSWMAENSEYLDKLERYRRTRKAVSEHKTKNYPFPNSSNIEVPLISWLCNTVFGHLKNTFSTRSPLWTVKSRRGGDNNSVDEAKILTKYTQMLVEGKNDLNFEEHEDTLYYETGSLGTCFAYVPWLRDRWVFKRRDDDGNVKTVDALLHDGPIVEPIAPDRFRFEEGFRNLQVTPWIDHEFDVSVYDLQNKGAWGEWDSEAVEELVEYVRVNGPVGEQSKSDARVNADQIRGNSSGTMDGVTLQRFYGRWDVDDDGIYEDIFVIFHKDSGIVLFEDFNQLGKRPYASSRYLIDPYQVRGRGVCELVDQMQREASFWHNFKNDNAKLAGFRMFGVRTTALLKNKEGMYPGKMWRLDEPKNDITSIQMAEIYPSSGQAENVSIQYGQRNAALPDVMGGFADQTLGSRDTAGGQQTRLQQSMGVFGAISDGVQRALGEVGELVVYQLVANKDLVIENERVAGRLSEDEIDLLESALDVELEDIPKKFEFSVATTTVDETLDAKRQNVQLIWQIYQMYWQTANQAIMQMFNPELEQMPGKEQIKDHFVQQYTGLTSMMSEILNSFQISDDERYLPAYEKYQKVLELKDFMEKSMVRQMKEQMDALRTDGSGQFQGNGPGPGMENPPGGSGGANDAGIPGGAPGANGPAGPVPGPGGMAGPQ